MILAGDVGGTKCNLALFSEKDGNLAPVFRHRFASKEFAQFDLIVKEFSRQANEHLGGDSRLRRPDVAWIVFDPTRLGEDLPEFLLRDGDDRAGVVEQNRA